MIGHIEHGSDFGGLFRYLLADDKGARIIGGNSAGRTSFELTQEFNNCADQRRTTTKPVKHFIISFAPEDEYVSDAVKARIAKFAVQELGYTYNQYLVVDHHRDDPGHDWNHDHDHIHIAVNMITLDGKRVEDWQDKRQFEQILRQLEYAEKLTPVPPSKDRKRKALSHGQTQRIKREIKEFKQGIRTELPEIPLIVKLQAAIDAASSARPTMTSFLGRLQHLGIDVRPSISDRGRKGISYRLGDFKVKGSKLHNASFPKLISERGIDFDEVRDTPALEAAYQGKPVAIDNKRSLSGEEIDQVPADFVVIRRSTLDLDYWLPQPLKALANAHSSKEVREVADLKQWPNLQQKLLDHYGIPENISDSLNKANLLKSDEMGEPIWQKRSLLGSKDSHFWFEINDSGARVKKIVVANSPVETISAYLVDRLVNKDNCPCLYLSLDSAEQLNELNLTQFNTIVVNNNDQQLVSDSVSNLVVEKNVSSWQQSWLTYWNEIQRILQSETKNNSTSLERPSSKDKQLEL